MCFGGDIYQNSYSGIFEVIKLSNLNNDHFDFEIESDLEYFVWVESSTSRILMTFFEKDAKLTVSVSLVKLEVSISVP